MRNHSHKKSTNKDNIKTLLLIPQTSRIIFSIRKTECTPHLCITTQLTILFCSLEEGSYSPQVAFMPQEEGLHLTSTPVVDREGYCMHTQRIIAEKIPTKIHLDIHETQNYAHH
jgi:hypothetical protein